MAVSFRERPTSRSAESSPRRITLNYSLGGVGDDAYARWYVTGATPVIYDGLFRQTIKLTAQGGGLWDVEIPYGPIEKSEFSLSFDTTGESAHITQAKDHIQTHTPTGVITDPPHEGAIGVIENGQVDGTDIIVPQFRWTERRELPIAYASFTYAKILTGVTGKVNLNPFRNFAAGEVRFDGAQGGASNKDPDKCSLTFHFTQSDDTPNAMPSFKNGILKRGWEYLWVEYERDTKAVDLVTKPKWVHVERVYDAIDFGVLGIGV